MRMHNDFYPAPKTFGVDEKKGKRMGLTKTIKLLFTDPFHPVSQKVFNYFVVGMIATCITILIVKAILCRL